VRREVHLGVKHLLDRLASGVFLCLFAPLLLGISLLIVLDSGWPPFFLQARVGRRGQPFNVYKFRTMVRDAVHHGLATTVSQSDDRITRVGSFLRAWSLDELPQLLNVLKGEMSLVGPRPTLDYQVAQYSPYQRRRLEVKPGITGWAQVNGRNSLPWPKRIELDVWYVDHVSLWLDLRILFRTVGVFLRREGLYGPDGVNDDFVSRRRP
jgi:lipopolysaccharide/colanic/teichoic acid biosynthesis glycosyltransferase